MKTAKYNKSIYFLVMSCISTLVLMSFIKNAYSYEPTYGQSFMARVTQEVTVTVKNYNAVHQSQLWVRIGDNNPRWIITPNTSVGTKVSIGRVTAGTPIQFFIKNITIGETWYAGPAVNNRDNTCHVMITNPSDLLGKYYLGFEDLPYGGDFDYDDRVYFITNVVPIEGIIEDFVDQNDIDNDGDGFSENQNDLNDADSSIYPGATEICSDGIDQDCNGRDEACPVAELNLTIKKSGFYKVKPISPEIGSAKVFINGSELLTFDTDSFDITNLGWIDKESTLRVVAVKDAKNLEGTSAQWLDDDTVRISYQYPDLSYELELEIWDPPVQPRLISNFGNYPENVGIVYSDGYLFIGSNRDHLLEKRTLDGQLVTSTDKVYLTCDVQLICNNEGHIITVTEGSFVKLDKDLNVIKESSIKEQIGMEAYLQSYEMTYSKSANKIYLTFMDWNEKIEFVILDVEFNMISRRELYTNSSERIQSIATNNEDGEEFVYAYTQGNHNKIVKMRVSDLTVVNQLNLIAPFINCLKMSLNGDYLYAVKRTHTMDLQSSVIAYDLNLQEEIRWEGYPANDKMDFDEIGGSYITMYDQPSNSTRINIMTIR